VQQFKALCYLVGNLGTVDGSVYEKQDSVLHLKMQNKLLFIDVVSCRELELVRAG
jgi:hypothetical protein